MKIVNGKSVGIPTNTIKQNFNKKTKYHVTKEVVINVKQKVETYLEYLIDLAIRNIEETNVLREKANLPKQKRISVSHLKNLPHNSYIAHSGFLGDERGKVTRTRLSKANEVV